MEFTDDEIREELARLGYENVPSDKLAEFKKDLLNLIQTERSKNTSLNSSVEEQTKSVSPDVRDGSEYVSGNFTNHGSQWIDQGYVGQHFGKSTKSAGMVRATSDMYSKSEIPRFYAMHELPLELDSHDRKSNDNNNMDNTDPCLFEEDNISSTTSNSTKGMKRKTCRVLENGCRRVDESFCDSETDGIFQIYEKIKSMALRDCECGKAKKTSSDIEPPYRVQNKPNPYPSYITKKMCPPNCIVRENPTAKLNLYKKMWKVQPAIGENDRKKLKKKVHAKMMEKDEIKLDQRVYVPNKYVVPTEKNRTALRWKVRHHLANYEVPPHGLFHDL